MTELNYDPKCGDSAWPGAHCGTAWADSFGHYHACWLRTGHPGDCICACDMVYMRSSNEHSQ